VPEVLHPLTDEQRALLDFVLSEPFKGRSELVEQARQVQTRGSSCDCGCPSFYLDVDHALAPASVERAVPTEAHGKALDGSSVQVLLFVRDGYLSELEVVWYGPTPPAELPRPADLQISRWSEPNESGARSLLNP